MVDEDKTSIKISPFSGKHTDWPVWQEKFLARARRKGYKKILLGQVTIPSNADTAASGTRFVNQYVDEGFIKFVFVGTKDNDADLFTKNLSGESHDRHGDKMVGQKE
jgi:hypothetical protein